MSLNINNKQNTIEYFITKFKNGNLKEKLYALHCIECNVYERFTYDRLTGEEIWIANTLLEWLVGEQRVKVLDEILDTLLTLTDCVSIPQAKWEILVSEMPRFKDDWLIEESIALIGRTCHIDYIDLIRPFCASNNQSIVQAATEAIVELEFQSQKIKQPNV
jgi:hypothetical protein